MSNELGLAVSHAVAAHNKLVEALGAVRRHADAVAPPDEMAAGPDRAGISRIDDRLSEVAKVLDNSRVRIAEDVRALDPDALPEDPPASAEPDTPADPAPAAADAAGPEYTFKASFILQESREGETSMATDNRLLMEYETLEAGRPLSDEDEERRHELHKNFFDYRG